MDDPPEILVAKDVSDHCACSLSLRPAAVRPPAKQAISPEVCRHPRFAAAACALEQAVGLDGLPSLARLDLDKEILREAAKVTREEMLQSETRSEVASAWLVSSLARAFFAQDRRWVRFLQARHAEARLHLRIVGLRVELCDPPAFSQVFADAQQSCLRARQR